MATQDAAATLVVVPGRPSADQAGSLLALLGRWSDDDTLALDLPGGGTLATEFATNGDLRKYLWPLQRGYRVSFRDAAGTEWVPTGDSHALGGMPNELHLAVAPKEAPPCR